MQPFKPHRALIRLVAIFYENISGIFLVQKLCVFCISGLL